MTILVKNKHTLQIDEFKFKCCIGKNGSTRSKKEGDKKTPKGTFEIQNLYFRKDKLKKPLTSLKCISIKKSMGWCNDIRFPRKYNKLFKIEKRVKHERLKRKDYKPTVGCIALKKKDLLIVLKLIKKNSKIKIF